MSKTKYIKVMESEIRNLKSQVYFTFDDDFQKSTRLFDGMKRKFFGRTQPVEVLIEAPDREDEMMEMLEECRLQLEYLNNKTQRGTSNSILSRLNTLLNSIK